MNAIAMSAATKNPAPTLVIVSLRVANLPTRNRSAPTARQITAAITTVPITPLPMLASVFVNGR